MRVIQKTLIDFDKIDTSALSYQYLGYTQTATDLRNAKSDILSAYDKQAANYAVLLVFYEDKHTTSKIVPRDFPL